MDEFILSILEKPSDKDLRLVFADYLEEIGNKSCVHLRDDVGFWYITSGTLVYMLFRKDSGLAFKISKYRFCCSANKINTFHRNSWWCIGCRDLFEVKDNKWVR